MSAMIHLTSSELKPWRVMAVWVGVTFGPGSCCCRTPSEMQGKLTVAFHGEEGIDAGGVSREWYQVSASPLTFSSCFCLILAYLLMCGTTCSSSCRCRLKGVWCKSSAWISIRSRRLGIGSILRGHPAGLPMVGSTFQLLGTYQESITGISPSRACCVQVMAREIFNPNFSLFVPVPMGGSTFQPNPNSVVQNDEARGTNHLDFFKFVGRVVGKALHDGQYIDAYFTRSFYKHMLGQPLTYQVLCFRTPSNVCAG